MDDILDDNIDALFPEGDAGAQIKTEFKMDDNTYNLSSEGANGAYIKNEFKIDFATPLVVSSGTLSQLYNSCVKVQEDSNFCMQYRPAPIGSSFTDVQRSTIESLYWDAVDVGKPTIAQRQAVANDFGRDLHSINVRLSFLIRKAIC
jgi:hypothetical protein